MNLMHIGLRGYAGHGKDTAALGLIDTLGYARRAFADEFKEDIGCMLLRLDPNVPENRALGWRYIEEHKAALRPVLQEYGNQMRSFRYEDVWIDKALSWLGENNPDAPRVIPDVRYPNEIARLRELGFSIVRIYRPDAPNATITLEQRGHISETASNDIPSDVIVVNDGTAEDLSSRMALLARSDALYSRQRHPHQRRAIYSASGAYLGDTLIDRLAASTL